MQQFPCPFCGLRDEREFHYAGEAGKIRPPTQGARHPEKISADEWGAYLHDQDNPKGPTREIWLHLTCAELFVMERDSVTMAVAGASALRKGEST